MWAVVKLGGSHAVSPHLKDWIGEIAGCGRIVVVPGGGPFADAVRDAQPRMGFDDRAAHRMAILAMEQYACALASLDKRFLLSATIDEMWLDLDRERVAVWLPAEMVFAASEIPWSWDVTSDSLAAWLAGRMRAPRLVLVKHGEWRGGAIAATELAAQGVVDAAFPQFLAQSGTPACIVGAADHAGVGAAMGARAPLGTEITC
jgi:dihydroneopterin aldolase